MPARKAFISQLREEAGPTEWYVDKGFILPMPSLEQLREWEDSPPTERNIKTLMGDADFARAVEYWDPHPASYWKRFIDSYIDFVYGRGAFAEGK